MLSNEEFSVAKDNLLTNLPLLSKEYELDFEINVKNFPNSWVSVLHFTTGTNGPTYGSRTPAFFGSGGSNPQLTMSSSINGNYNRYKSINITTNKWVKIKVSQIKNSDGSYFFKCSNDNVIVWKIINNQAADFENVKVFASNPWYPPFNGTIRNIVIFSKGK